MTAGGSTRAVDAAAFLGGALVLVGMLWLALTWVPDLWVSIALLGSVGGAAGVLAWGTRRLRPPGLSDVLAGIAAVALTLCFDTVLDATSVVVGPAPRWILICIPALVFGGAFCWGLRSRAAGAWAVVGWALLPMALATGGEERLGFTLPLTVTVAEGTVWVALVLMLGAVTLAEQGAYFASRRGWITPGTAVWVAFIASSVLGVILVAAAMVQGQAWFYFLLVAGAAVATGVSVWRHQWVWLPTASRLFSTAAVTALGGIDDGPGRAMGLVVLSLSFFSFTPLARRLPTHISVRFWEATIWVMGFAVSCAFAFAPGAWPAVGAFWAAGVIGIAASQRRALPMVLGALAAYVIFIVVVIDAAGAIAGAGFGTMAFGIALLIAVTLTGMSPRAADLRRRFTGI